MGAITIRPDVLEKHRSLFGAKTVRFTAAGRKVVCIRVPFRAKTFDARTRLRVSLAVALEAGASPRPRSRPIRLTP